MTDRKQSAHARREARKLQDITTSADNTTTNNFNTFVSETVQNIANINNQLTNVNNQTSSTTISLNNQLNPFDSASWESRITTLENATPSGGGGGGIDPSDPTQPIILWDNFIAQSNGDESGTRTPYSYSTPMPTNSNLLVPNGLEIYECNSETNHLGIVIVKLPSGTTSGIMSLTNTSGIDSFTFSDFNTMYFIIKTPTATPTDGYNIKMGLFDSPNSISQGIFVTGTRGGNWTPTVNDGTNITGSTTALANDTWYTIKIQKKSSTSVGFTINSGTEVVISSNVPTGFLTAGIFFENLNTISSSDIQFKIDFFGLRLKDTGTLTSGTTVVGTANEVEVTTVGSVITVGLPSSIIVDQATVDQINFDTTLTPADPLGDGVLAYDPSYQSLIMGLDGGASNTNINAPLGSALVKLVRNQTGSTINKGQVVYINGSHGSTTIQVALANASSEATAKDTIGVAAHNIANNTEGWIVTQGYLKGFTTNLTSGAGGEGDTLWLSTTAGAFTYNRPLAPNHGVVVGFMVKSAGSGAGSIYVKVSNGLELEELHDVLITGIADGHIIQWDNTDLRWENRSLSSAGIAAASHTHTLSGLTPLNATTLVGRWAGGGSGIAQEVTIGNGLKLSTGGVLAANTAQVADATLTLTAGTGLTGGGDLTANRSFAVDFATSGTSSSTQAVRANDSRLSDARTPLAHAHDGADITTGTIDTSRLLVGSAIGTICAGNDSRLSDSRTPLSHTHGNITNAGAIGSTSGLPIITNSGGVLTTGSFGTTSGTFCQGNDSRLSDARTPTTHTHTMADITDLREQKIFVECECNAAGEFSTISSNSGSNVFTTTGIDTTGGHYGILTSGTATTNNAVAGIGSADTTTATIFGTFKVETTSILMIPTLSTSAERFFIESGFTDNRTGTPVDGVLISYSDNQNSGKWIGLAYNNNTLTSVDLGITVAANTWYKLNSVINTNGSVDFYIDGVLKGSVAAASAPTGSTRATALSHTIRKTVGTTTRSLYIDYMNYIVWCSR